MTIDHGLHEHRHDPTLEGRVSRLEETTSNLLSSTSKIESMVETLVSSHQGTQQRLNRPWQWGVVIAGFVALITMAGLFNQTLALTVEPMKENIDQIHESALRYRESTDEVLTMLASNQNQLHERVSSVATDIKWMEKLEARTHFHMEKNEHSIVDHRIQNGDAH